MQKEIIIDVRTPNEFAGGHVAGSLNIPLNEVPDRVEELRAMDAHLVLCCASGNRSGHAANFLSAQGISCENGGGWVEVNYRIATGKKAS